MPHLKDLEKINREQKLYVFAHRHSLKHPEKVTGYSCLGFDVTIRRATALATELGIPVPKLRRGTRKALAFYDAALSVALARNQATGWRSQSELTPQLIGLEGKRVEVVDSFGSTRRFYVGKSTGWVPCHLEIARQNCHGGGAVYSAPFKSVRVIGDR